MSDLNTCSFTGRITRDALYKDVGTGLADFSIAINGMKQEDVIFMKIALWGKSAKSLLPYLLKGKQIAVSGSLKQGVWEDKVGKEHKDITLNAFSVTLLGSKNDSSVYPDNNDAGAYTF